MRRNGSMYAHVVVVRGGESPFPGDHNQVSHDPDDDSAMWYHFFPNLIYARGTITRYLVPVARNRTMLLGGQDKDNTTAEDGNSNTAEEVGVGGNGTDGGQSETAAQWLVNSATGFGLSAMATPNVITSAGRYAMLGLGAANVPGFVRSVQKAVASDEGSLDDVIQLSSGPPITHWKSRLDINIVQDFELYTMQRNGATPGLFIEFSKRHDTLLNRFYKVYMPGQGEQRAPPPRYAPWVEVDEFSLITK